MLRPKGCVTLFLCLSLAFFLLSSAIVSSIRIGANNVLATSEAEGEETVETEHQEEEEQASDGDQQQEEGQQEDSNIQEPMNGDLPQEDVPPEDQPVEGDQTILCSGIISPETGECEEVQVADRGFEICDNSVDDNLDGKVDESDCIPAEGESPTSNPLTTTTPNQLGGEPGNWGLPQETEDGGPTGITTSPNPPSGDWGLPEPTDDPNPTEGTEMPSFAMPPSDPYGTTSAPSSNEPFSPLVDSGLEGSTEATDSLSREQGTTPTPTLPSSPSPAPLTYEKWHNDMMSDTPPPCDSPPPANMMETLNYDDNCPVQYQQLQQQPQTGSSPSSSPSDPAAAPPSQATPEPTEPSVPPEDQSTDQQPVDLAQLCNSLTIQTVTDLDCGQFQPGGVQPAAAPTDQAPTDQAPTDQTSDVSPPLLIDRVQPRQTFLPTVPPHQSGTIDIDNLDPNSPDAFRDALRTCTLRVCSLLFGIGEGYIPFASIPGDWLLPSYTLPDDLASLRSAGQTIGTLASIPKMVKGLATSVGKLMTKGTEGGIRVGAGGAAAIERATSTSTDVAMVGLKAVLLTGGVVNVKQATEGVMQMAKNKGNTGSGETPPVTPPATPGPSTPLIPPKVLKDAKKFGLKAESPTSRQILDNLDMDAKDFISNFRKAGIVGEFPGEYLKEGVSLRKALQEGGSTVRKLLTDGRFAK